MGEVKRLKAEAEQADGARAIFILPIPIAPYSHILIFIEVKPRKTKVRFAHNFLRDFGSFRECDRPKLEEYEGHQCGLTIQSTVILIGITNIPFSGPYKCTHRPSALRISH